MSTILSKGNAHGVITEADVKTHGPERPPQFTDEGALRLVVKDAARFEAWLDQKQWALQWRETDILYQSPRSLATFEGGPAMRANVSRFTVAKHTNSLTPTMMSGLFYEDPPFVLRPYPSTTQSTVRAKTVLMSALLSEMGFKTECENGLESVVLNGTGIWKWGWTREKRIVKKFIRKTSPNRVNLPLTGESEIHTEESDEFTVEERVKTVNRPFFEQCPLGTVLVEPGWRHPNQIWRAKAVIHRQYLTFDDLNKLRDQDGYDIPSEEELKSLFFAPVEVAVAPGAVEQQQNANQLVHHAEGRDQQTTEDPLMQPLKVDERWDKDRVITVVQDKLIIRNEEHGLGKICFLSSNWWNIQNAGYGMGIGRLVGSDQRVDQGATNGALDILSMAVNQQYVRSRGANVPTQQIKQRLGGIIDVDGDVEKAFKILESPKVPSEVWTAIQMSKASSESLSGADEAMVQGSLPQKGGSSVGRSGTGAAGLIAASAGRIQGPVGRFVENVFIPFLAIMDEMICERMPLSEIREILSEEAEDLKVDFNNFMNARLKYEVLAGAHLAAKKAMAQSLPFLIQIFENPHMLESLNKMGWTIDVKELFDMLMDMSEWKNARQVVRKMTKEEQQAYQAASNQTAPKLQSDLVKMKAAHDFTSEEIDQKGEAKLAAKLLESAGDRATGYVERVATERAMMNSPYLQGMRAEQ